jgi:hypothetical protein
MFESNPVLRERLLAAAVFGAVGIGSIAAVDTLVTGGLDFPIVRTAQAHTAAQPYAIAASDWAIEPRAELASRNTPEIGAENYPADDLDGGADTQSSAYAPSEEEIYSEIRALYDESEAFPEDDPLPVATGDASEKAANAYESASPW